MVTVTFILRCTDWREKWLYNVGIILCIKLLYVSKHSKYKIMAPTEILMVLQIEELPHIFSTSGAIVPTTSFAS